MARKNIRNFDAMIAEMNHETVAFTMFGKTYEIEKRMPATIPLELARYEDEDNVPNSVIFRAAKNIFGDDTLRELCEHPQFTVDVLSELIKWAFDAINGGGDDPHELEEMTEDDFGAVSERKN